MGIRVHLDGDAPGGGLGEHLIEIDRVRLALQQHPTRGVTEDREMGVVHGGEHAPRHFVFGHAEARVDRSDHEVEPVEHVWSVVERAVRQDVGLDAFEHADAGDPGIHPVDFVVLLGHVLSDR